MDELVGGVIDNLHQRAQDAGATVTAGPIPAIENDRMAVEQILSNLLENAIKYLSPARAGEIRIEGQRVGRTVQVDVIDNGRGISQQDHERIFELFRRSGAQDTQGEGIGLAHVRALAYRLGGLIEVESELDRGSRFRLSLPARFVSTEQTHE
jgi:signal transduction histidine kinase